MELTHLPVNRIKPLCEEPPRLMDGLRQDHRLLAGELAVLKQAESGTAAQLWQALREVCARLALGLQDHILREEQLKIRPSVDHYSDYRYLQVITRHVTSEKRPFLLNSRYQLLTDFLHGLQRHMNEQETEIFPSVEPVTTYTAREAVKSIQA